MDIEYLKSRHLITNERWLEEPQDASGVCFQPNGQPLTISKMRSVKLVVKAMGKEQTSKLKDVYYPIRLKHNLHSYGVLDRRDVHRETRIATRLAKQ